MKAPPANRVAAWQPFAKAITPAILTLIAVGVDWLILGTFERQTAAIAITGLISATVVYFVPNTQPLAPIDTSVQYGPPIGVDSTFRPVAAGAPDKETSS